MNVRVEAGFAVGAAETIDDNSAKGVEGMQYVTRRHNE